MPSQMTPDMKTYREENPSLRNLALARDKDARDYFGDGYYDLYDQGCTQVITNRTAAPAAGVAATSSPSPGAGRKVRCSLCDKDVHDFSRHNRETHIQDPGKTFFCPHNGCVMKTMRDGQITIDDHLAAAHKDFRNMDARGGDLLERSNKSNVLGKLTIESARYVAEYRQGQVAKYEEDRAELIEQLKTKGINSPKLEAATLPDDLKKGAVDTRVLTKAAAIDHAILVRNTLNNWDALIKEAKNKLAKKLEKKLK